MLDPIVSGSRFSFFIHDSVRRWNFWLSLCSILCLTALFSYEATGVRMTRRAYVVRLALPNYLFTLMASLFIPTTYKGDGRFWGFFLTSNDLFLLFYLCQFNPFYIASTQYPSLESMNKAKLYVFAFVEGIFLLAIGAAHLAYGWYFTEVNEMNTKYYQNLSVASRDRTSEYFSNICLLPAITYTAMAVMQFVVRTIKAYCDDEPFYENEQNSGLREKIREYKQELQNERKISNLIKERINKKKKQNFD